MVQFLVIKYVGAMRDPADIIHKGLDIIHTILFLNLFRACIRQTKMYIGSIKAWIGAVGI